MKIFVLLCLATTALAVPAQDSIRIARNSIQTENNLLDSVYQDCLKKDTVSCLKYKVFSVVDKVLSQSDITVTDGVQIVKTSEPTGAPRALSENDGIESVLFNKVATFLDTHELKVNLNGKEIMDTAAATARSISESFSEDDDDDDEDSLDEGRGKGGKKKIKKIKKMFGPIFGIIALKAGFLIKLAIIGLALLAGKALIVSKIALILAGILAIKKLFGSKLGGLGGGLGGFGGSSHEVHGGYGGDIGGGYGGGYGGSSGHGGWGRSTDAQKLAYSGYAQPQETQS